MQDIIKGHKNTDLIPVLCTFCKNKFNRKVRDIKMSIRKKGNNIESFCSNSCANKQKDRKVYTQCITCNEDVTIRYCELNSKYRKSKNVFCSRSCAAVFNNKKRSHKAKKRIVCTKVKRNSSFHEKICTHCNVHYKTKSKKSTYCSGRCRNLNLKLHAFAHKSSGRSRSRMEEYLERRLSANFPDLEIKFNDKDIIYYELDIHIPKYNLAFELNGVFHYLPIYGEETLKKTQYKDQQKIIRCKEKNIDLHVINLGNTCFSKERGERVYTYITDIIKHARDRVELSKCSFAENCLTV